jgi:hypothetical protein
MVTECLKSTENCVKNNLLCCFDFEKEKKNPSLEDLLNYGKIVRDG